MSDTLKLALRISAVDLFSGVLRRFRNEVAGSGVAAQAMQRDYDNMIRHSQAGLKSLAVANFAYDKLKPAVQQAADLQESLLAVEGILQGSHPNAEKLADQMARVRANSIDVAKHMKFNATAITDVTRELLQAGVPLKAILGPRGAAFSVEALAEVSKTDPAETAKNMANIGHAFQLRPEQYGEAADLVARASITGSGSITQLFHNLEQVGAIAHMSGNTDLKATLVALKALAPLGEQGGSDLAAVIQTMEGGRLRGTKYMHKAGLDFYDKKGDFIGLDAAIEKLRVHVNKLPTQEMKLRQLGLIFQAGGSKAIEQLLAPSTPGVKSYEEVKASVDDQASLAQRMATWEKGLNAQLQELSTTNQSTLAAMFDPMLGKMTEAIALANKLSGAIGTLASKHRGVAVGVSATSVGVIAAAGGYGVYRLGQAGFSLKSFLKGKAGLAGGIAEGKAIQAATGVAPVFVTNFPAGFGSTAAVAENAAAKTAARDVAAGSLGATIKSILGFAGPAAAGAGGIYALSKTAIDLPEATQAAQDDADAERYKKGGRYDILQPKGETRHLTAAEVAARLAVEKQLPYGQWYEKNSSKYHFWENARPIDDYKKMVAQQAQQAQAAPTQVGGSIHIQIDQTGRAKVTKVQSVNPRVPLDVGSMMAVP